MGKNKALLPLGSKTVIEHIVHTLSTICDELILSTNTNDLDFLTFKKVADKIENLGPIAGFHSALSESKTRHNLIVSCDTPFISSELLSYLLKNKEDFDLVLPEFNNHLQPMVGYFNTNCLDIIIHQIKIGNIKPINIFENSPLRKIPITKELKFYKDYLFFNINTKKQYREACRIFETISNNT